MTELREVSKDEFWDLVKATKRNVHPSPERDRTVWRDQSTMTVVAVTTPGYLLTGAESYRVSRSL